MQRTINAGKLQDLRARLGAFESILGVRDREIPDADRLLTTARRRIAAEAIDEACRAFDRGRTGTEPVEEYIAFALKAYSEATSLPQWRSVKRRERIGARWSPRWPPFLLAAVLRRAREEIESARWWRSGI
jgi:hypothetical protein